MENSRSSTSDSRNSWLRAAGWMDRVRLRVSDGAASGFVARALPFVLAVGVSLTAQVPGARAAGVPDMNCRWAASVVDFSSQYSSLEWSAQQALGPPNTYSGYGDIPTAWASLGPDDQREFLVLAYDDPAPINFVNVYETWNPGALDTVSVKNPYTGVFEKVWTGTAAPAPGASRILTASFPVTQYAVSEVRLDFNSPAVPSWNEIDAVAIGRCVCSDRLVDVSAAAPAPAAGTLGAPWPNPFRSSTEFAFSLRTEGHVRIEVFNVLGQRVSLLVDRALPAGRHVVGWTGRDEGGRAMGSGIYYVRAEGDGIRETRKVVKIE